MILMIIYTRVTIGRENSAQEIESVSVSSGTEEKSPGSLLLTDKFSSYENAAEENSTNGNGQSTEGDSAQKDENENILGPAEKMDLDKARKQSYGLAIELDYVSESKISLHGKFGYMVFTLVDNKIALQSAVTLEELGGINMGGAAYTDILAGDGCALIVPGIHNEEIARRRKFLYVEETNEIQGGIVAPDWMMAKVFENDYSDAVTKAEYFEELTKLLITEYQSKLLYGPVVIPEYNSNTYGFLTETGENLEDLCYGLWNRDLGTVTVIPLFE